jgi:D-sedoheptulose 7-phosphate isomerase
MTNSAFHSGFDHWHLVRLVRGFRFFTGFAIQPGSTQNSSMTPQSIQQYFTDHSATAQKTSAQLATKIAEIAKLLIDAFSRGNRLYTLGNGGSAADAMHFAEELLGRFQRDRRSLPATALNSDGTAMTCICNDYGYDEIFSRQIQALATKGDVVLAFSTSGNSENVLRGLRAAKEKSAITVALLGKGGGKAAAIADHSLIIPADVTSHVQEMHMLIVHLLCDAVDRWAAGVA